MVHALEVNGISKEYHQTPVLQKVSFRLKKGECLGLMGESGSGKSTLARCIVGIQPVNEGTIHLLGERIDHLSDRQLKPFRRKLQLVLQNPAAALNPKKRIADSLLDPYLFLGKDGSHQHFSASSKALFVKELLDAVKLPEELAARYPHELSGGQRQRVNIARAISIEPDVLILDEPTASLDVVSQSSILQLLTELREELGLSYLFISHDLASLHDMSDRIMVMKDGRLVDDFQSRDIFSSNRHDYTKELIAIF